MNKLNINIVSSHEEIRNTSLCNSKGPLHSQNSNMSPLLSDSKTPNISPPYLESRISFNKKKSFKVIDPTVRAKNISYVKKDSYSPSKSPIKQLQPHQRFIDLKNEQDLEIVMNIMKKSLKNRTQEDTLVLRNAFQNIKFFAETNEQLNKDSILNLYKELKPEFFNKRATVFEINEIGTKFYIILQGSVYLLLSNKGLEDKKEDYKENHDIKEDENDKKERIRDELVYKIRDGLDNLLEIINKKSPYNEKTTETIHKYIKKYMNLDKSSMKIDEKTKKIKLSKQFLQLLNDQNYLTLMYSDLILAKELKSGDSFGELALNKSIPRTATIVCKEDTLFAVLTRKSYKEILSYHMHNIEQENVDFFQKISFFKQWKTELIEQFYYQLQPKKLTRNTILYSEGKIPIDIFFIKSGEIEMCFSMNEQDIKENKYKPNLLKELKKKNNNHIRIAALGPGEIFGHEEIFTEEKTRKFIAKVSKDSLLLQITKQNFFQLVKNEKTLNEFRENAIFLMKYRLSQIETLKGFSQNFKSNNKSLSLNQITNDLNINKQNQITPLASVVTLSKNNVFRLNIQKTGSQDNSSKYFYNQQKNENLTALTHRSKETDKIKQKIKIYDQQKIEFQELELSFLGNPTRRKTSLKPISYLKTEKDFNNTVNRIKNNCIKQRDLFTKYISKYNETNSVLIKNK